MPRNSSASLRHNELLRRARELAAVRVKVVTVLGQSEFKDLASVAPDDEIQAKTNGEPIVMLARPGRRGARLTKGEPVNAAVAEQVDRKREALRQDPILKALLQDPDSPDVLNCIIRGIVEESASLAFERQEAELDGKKDTSGLSGRRIQALRAVGETWLKRMDQIAGKSLDLEGPAFKKVFGLLIETLREAMTSLSYRDEEIDTIMAKFSGLITDEWKAEAKNRIKSV